LWEKKSQRKNRDSLEALLIKKLEEEGRIFERKGKQFSFFSKQKQISTKILIENPKNPKQK